MRLNTVFSMFYSLSKAKMSANHSDWNSGYETIVNRLVDSWANVNLANAEGQTPLHYAAIGGKSTRFIYSFIDKIFKLIFLQIIKTFLVFLKIIQK